MTNPGSTESQLSHRLRLLGRIALAALLLVAGTGHFVETEVFRAQVPTWFPARDAVVIVSGVVELALGLALLFIHGRRSIAVGLVVAAFFVLVFPGNISQFITGTDAFGLDTDLKRGVRLIFQPVLVLWALWAGGGLRYWRTRGRTADQTA